MKEILIRMTEKQYDSLNEMSLIELHSIIRNGIPLPKGHGMLIDADVLRKQWSADDACEHDYTHLHFLESIDSAPTIIEADKEGAEE